MINESHLPGAQVGELGHAILVDPFTRLRDGDRYWYEGHVPEPYLSFVRIQKLSDILRRNTEIGAELDDDAFRAL